MSKLVFIIFYLEWFLLGFIYLAIIAICGTSKYSFIFSIFFFGVLAYYFVINSSIRSITKTIIIVILFISMLALLVYVSCETVYATGEIPSWSSLVADYSYYSDHLESCRNKMKTDFSEVTTRTHPKYEDKLDILARIQDCTSSLKQVDQEAEQFYGKTVSSELGKDPQIPTSNKRAFETSFEGPSKR